MSQVRPSAAAYSRGSKRGTFTSLNRRLEEYMPVYAAWAAIVVIVFPPAFGYV